MKNRLERKQFSTPLLQKRTLIILIGAVAVSHGQTITCPVLSCDNSLQNTLESYQCFQHDNSMPVASLSLQKCGDYQLDNPWVSGTPLCQLNLQNGQYAWYDESTQNLANSASPWDSAVYQKKIRADCRQAASLLTNLNNGRSCVDSSQCYSKNCLGSVCQGLDIGVYCHSNADCHSEYYC